MWPSVVAFCVQNTNKLRVLDCIQLYTAWRWSDTSRNT